MSSLYLNWFGHSVCDGDISPKDLIIERAKQFGFMRDFRDTPARDIPHSRKPGLSEYSQDNYLEKLDWLEYLKTLDEERFQKEKQEYFKKTYDDRETELQKYRSHIQSYSGIISDWMPAKGSIAFSVRESVFEELDKTKRSVEEALETKNIHDYAESKVAFKFQDNLEKTIECFEKAVKDAEKNLTVSPDELKSIRIFNEFFRELDAYDW